MQNGRVSMSRPFRRTTADASALMRPAGRSRLVISGLVALGLLLLPFVTVHAPMAAQPDAAQTSHMLMLSMIGHDPCTDTSCMPHAATDGDCCQGTSCTFAFFIPVMQSMTPDVPTPEQYWTRSGGGIGQTPEPDIGPPISRA
jgi:hypothetical protein